MLRVGLTGGIASGKTFVGRALVALGCPLLEADELGHEVLLRGGEAYDSVIREFGPGILEKDGTIDRQKLAAEVFDRPERLRRLNGLIHPHVIRREEQWFSEVAARDSGAIAVMEAAILIETGSYQRFDRVILVICEPEQQIARAMERGLTREQVAARLSRQMPLEEKRKYADYVIDTSGTKEDTVHQAERVYASLREVRDRVGASK